jgi:hypothetical protein
VITDHLCRLEAIAFLFESNAIIVDEARDGFITKINPVIMGFNVGAADQLTRMQLAVILKNDLIHLPQSFWMQINQGIWGQQALPIN